MMKNKLFNVILDLWFWIGILFGFGIFTLFSLIYGENILSGAITASLVGVLFGFILSLILNRMEYKERKSESVKDRCLNQASIIIPIFENMINKLRTMKDDKPNSKFNFLQYNKEYQNNLHKINNIIVIYFSNIFIKKLKIYYDKSFELSRKMQEEGVDETVYILDVKEYRDYMVLDEIFRNICKFKNSFIKEIKNI